MRALLVGLFLLGCTTTLPEPPCPKECPADLVCLDEACQRWICYRPGHELHMTPCSEECWVSGDPFVFCYLDEDIDAGL